MVPSSTSRATYKEKPGKLSPFGSGFKEDAQRLPDVSAQSFRRIVRLYVSRKVLGTK